MESIGIPINDIRPGHITVASTSHVSELASATKRWTVEVKRSRHGETVRITANFLWMCQGYYAHDKGLYARMGGCTDLRQWSCIHRPWAEDLDYKGAERRPLSSGLARRRHTLVPGRCGRLQARHPAGSVHRPIHSRGTENSGMASSVSLELRKLEIGRGRGSHEIVSPARSLVSDKN